MALFSELVGQTLREIINNGDELVFTAVDGARYTMYHSQECCESVILEDVVGDFADLVGTPLVEAYESTGEDAVGENGSPGVGTWTFYRIRTIKGTVTLRWYGESNGCYSESVDFYRHKEDAPDGN